MILNKIMAYKQNKYVFYVNDPGDPSVGINPASTKITVETDYILDRELIEETYKPCIAEMLDVRVKHVQTEEEFLQEQRDIVELERAMDQAEEEFRKSMDRHDEYLRSKGVGGTL